MATTANDRAPSRIQIAGMNKWYGDFHVLRDINLDGLARASAS